ncbi:PREDICTED: uncharacterized protein LOC104605219 [Nelumbo nucifera]|uniref:Uncharacterized protein LOC104605219 n=1 Tax=Nelumbo nucifera TaxID=4432 RepID=A0A1U8AXW1_NELNU|nr:PREDICTED: uncharacterized protein LOC104605219 [Nelumbo nucifera]
MVDDFMVCVDRIIASTCFDSVNEGYERTARGDGVENVSVNNGVFVKNNGEGCSKKEEKKGEMIECRICQEEDEEHEMEAPCGCSGTLKFAHRKCIQKWCNKKGDITCEICNQVFSPNYSLPPTRTNPDGMAIDISSIRQAWGQQYDLHEPHFLALTAAEHQLLRSQYDEYAAANNGAVAFFRSIALILMLILLIRNTLMITRDSGILQETSTFFNVSVLQLAGLLLPCYVMVRSCYIIHSRRRRQE